MDINKSAEPAFVTIQNRMEEIHLADLETCVESEARASAGQQVS